MIEHTFADGVSYTIINMLNESDSLNVNRDGNSNVLFVVDKNTGNIAKITVEDVERKS